MYLPLILKVKALIVAVNVAQVPDAVLPDVVAVVSGDAANGAAGKRITPENLERAVGEVGTDVIRDPRTAVAKLEDVLLPGYVRDVIRIEVHVLPGGDVFHHAQSGGNVSEPSGTRKSGWHGDLRGRRCRLVLQERQTG